MITRETRKLVGLVHKVEIEFAVFEIIDGKLTETTNHSRGHSVYDLEGKLVEDVSPYRLMMYDAYKDVYFYNEKGDLDYREEYDANDSLIGKTIFEKSIKGNLIERRFYFDTEGKFKIGSHFVYEGNTNDDEDSIIESAHYDENEKIIPESFHQYDPSEHTKKKIINTDNGYIVEELRFNEKGIFSHRIKTVYDSQGNRKEHFCYEPDGTLYLKDEFVYKFDSTGNWIEQIDNHWVIGWGEFKLTPLSITRRRIEYFDKK
jgi:hypothetical protein